MLLGRLVLLERLQPGLRVSGLTTVATLLMGGDGVPWGTTLPRVACTLNQTSVKCSSTAAAGASSPSQLLPRQINRSHVSLDPPAMTYTAATGSISWSRMIGSSSARSRDAEGPSRPAGAERVAPQASPLFRGGRPQRPEHIAAAEGDEVGAGAQSLPSAVPQGHGGPAGAAASSYLMLPPAQPGARTWRWCGPPSA
jgi:hypothetical protein